MSSNLENPMSFKSSKESFGHSVRLKELSEVCQGGPVVGLLEIDGIEFDKKLIFGGPFCVLKEGLALPIFERGFFSSGFKFCFISWERKDFQGFDKRHDVLWIQDCSYGTAECALNIEGTVMITIRFK